jgi:hypothetical protein
MLSFNGRNMDDLSLYFTYIILKVIFAGKLEHVLLGNDDVAFTSLCSDISSTLCKNTIKTMSEN